MIREIVIYPLFALMFMGFALQLIDIAESTSDKALAFSYDMENAVDCATRAVDLKECSPGLYDHNFRQEIDKTIKLNTEMLDQIKSMLEEEYQQYDVLVEEDYIYISLE